MGAIINPEIYATIKLTNGEIDVKPELYATVVIAPKFESVRADTCRVISKSDSNTGDTLRQIGKLGSTSGDTQKVIQRSEKILGDTRRIVTATQSAKGDTLRIIGKLDFSRADTLQKIVRNEQVIGDTRKIIGVTQSAYADTLRVLYIPAGAYFKPELFAAVKLTKGEIDLNPLIYATVVTAPHSERVKADTLRRLAISDFSRADTLRQIGQLHTTRADTLKIICVDHSALADTLRVLVRTEKIFADTRLNFGISDNVKGDTLRIVGRLDLTRADTLIKLAAKQKVRADTLIERSKFESVKADTLRLIIRRDKARADTLLRLVERARADTLKIIIKTTKTRADTVIRRPFVLKYVVENSPVSFRGAKNLLRNTAPSLINSFKDYGITAVNISLNEMTLSDNFQFETAHAMDINAPIRGQLLDYHFNFLVEETDQQNLVQSIKGMYDCDKLLYSHFSLPEPINTEITDSLSKILDAEQFLDYVSEIRSMSPTTQLFGYISAEEIISKIAHYFGLNCNVLIENFVPKNSPYSNEDTKTTYRDVLTQLFSWTSQLPQRQINVFIRGDTIHCIQRGKEISTFDISDLPHSRPNVHKKILRTLQQRAASSSQSVTSRSNSDGDNPNLVPIIYPDVPDDDGDNLGYWQDEDNSYPFTGTISYHNEETAVSLRYESGLVTKEDSTLINSQVENSSKTTFGYLTSDGNSYLASKKTENNTKRTTDVGTIEIITQTVSVKNLYFYTRSGEIYLGQETEVTTNETKEYTGDGSKLINSETDTSTRKTFHTPIGNGWYAQSVYVDGEAQGSNLSQGKPGNSISPYTIKRTNQIWAPANKTGDNSGDTGGTTGGDSGGDSGSGSTEDSNDWMSRLSATDDISFPVRGAKLLRELINALYWLNRKIQEEVSVDLISSFDNGVPSINHIVDFTERVILDGNEYFLVSNQINFTPRKFIQKLKLIRWYAQ